MKLILTLDGHPVPGECFWLELEVTPGMREQTLEGFTRSIRPAITCLFERLHPMPTGIKDEQKLIAAHLDHLRRWHG